MNFKVGDLISIEGQIVKIASRKRWQGISEFQLMEFITSSKKHGIELIEGDFKIET